MAVHSEAFLHILLRHKIHVQIGPIEDDLIEDHPIEDDLIEDHPIEDDLIKEFPLQLHV